MFNFFFFFLHFRLYSVSIFIVSLASAQSKNIGTSSSPFLKFQVVIDPMSDVMQHGTFRDSGTVTICK